MLPAENIKLLLNQEATGAAVAGAIDWLVEQTEEGDEAMIYFSGHGDVERNANTQPGFLLCWDSGPKIYMAGGTYSLYFLQEMVSTMSVQKKTKVILIADACRSGKLAGSAINGPQTTAENLSRQYQNEIKILSCQPNEYSLEGEQWGGGRGAFSFHLLEGLIGLADQNSNKEVNLMEIGRYLEDHVSPEVAPLSQVPMTVGSRMEVLAKVDAALLARLLESKKTAPAGFDVIGGKTPDGVYAELDSSIAVTYHAFRLALQNKRYFEPADSSADHYYTLLMSDPSAGAQHSFIRREYAVALQDDAQQSINALLAADPDALLRSRVDFYVAYKDFPRLLHRAADILGEEHYMYNNLKAREYLFEGVLLYFKYRAVKTNTPAQGNEILACYNKSLEYEPELPVTHFFISICYAKILNEAEPAIKHAEIAVGFAGSWTLPYVHLAYFLAKEFKQFDAARQYLDQAMAMDSADAGVWRGWVSWHAYQNHLPEALEAAQKALTLAPNDAYNWMNFGNLKQSQYKFAEAESALLKSIELDSGLQMAYYSLGKNYYRWKKYDLAETYYLKAIALDPENEQSRTALAFFYAGFEKYAEAEAQFLELIRYTDPSARTWFDFAQVSTANGHAEAALGYLEKALEKGFRDRKKIEEEDALEPLRALPEYEELMRRYFKD